MSTIKTNQLAHTANGAAVYTLPQTDGSAGQILRTDGSGNLSWVNDSGKVLQVIYFKKTNAHSMSMTETWTDVTGYSLSITPTAANSKILIDFRFITNNNGHGQDMYVAVRRSINGGSFDEFTPTGNVYGAGNRHLTRNYGSNSRNEISSSMQYLDSPSYTLGQAIEYKMYGRSGNSSHTIELPSTPNGTPVLCFAMEIAA